VQTERGIRRGRRYRDAAGRRNEREGDDLGGYNRGEDEKRRHRRRLLKLLTCVGVLTLIIWLILDDKSADGMEHALFAAYKARRGKQDQDSEE
jgi:hypothetical protein